jgi:perosamine synthetase
MSDYSWPYLTDELRQGVQAQLHSSLSDRAGTGVIAEFEQAFAAFAGVEHAVAFSSGTAALHAMCVASGIGAGDAVIGCAYGFPATLSPFAFAGADVGFCDADEHGHLDLADAASLVDERTKAVVASHIWGNTEDCEALEAFCESRSLLLLQDGSHAHFAHVGGRPIATFGEAAAFSLNQKAITCGEGGVLVTDDPDLAARALLVGDYNHRCRTRPVSPELQPLVITGQGLKSRPHPLALAVGLHELARAGEIERRRRSNLAHLIDGVNELVPLIPTSPDVEHGLYVLALRAPTPEAAAAVSERAVADGCESLDIPGATGMMAHLARFHCVGPVASVEAKDVEDFRQRFPNAMRLSESVIKLPLWGYLGDEPVVDRYARLLQEL